MLRSPLRSSVGIVVLLLVVVGAVGCVEEGPGFASPSASGAPPAHPTAADAPSEGGQGSVSDSNGAAGSEGAAWVDAQMQQMTLDEKIGQLFVIRLNGVFHNAASPTYQETVDLVEEFEAGGIMFGPGTPMDQVTQINDLQQRAERPLLVTQDTEWGMAMRLDRTSRFPPAMALGATRDPSLAYRVGAATAREARALGVHQLYAPVADVNNNPDNPIINFRSFGEKPALVGTMAAAFVRGAQQEGTLATAKHFPGHGDTDVDSHADLPVLPFDYARLDTLELVPFRHTLNADVASVMTGHLALPALESDSTVPASLSPAVTTGLLRDSLGFDGLVVTDALTMNGVTKHFGPGEAAVRVLEAGADQILMSEDPYIARLAIREALDEGRLTEETIDTSVRRVLEAKAQLDLPDDRQVSTDTTRHEVRTRSHEVLAGTAARRSLTLLRNEGNLLPLTPPDQHDVLVVTLSDSEYPGTGRDFVRALRGAPGLGDVTTRRIDPRSDADDVEEHLADAREHDLVVVPSFLQVRAWSGTIGASDEHERFLRRVVERDQPSILVALGNPYVTGSLDAQPDVVLAGYGIGAASQRAAAHALVGAADTPGRLPITVPDVAEFGDGIEQPQVAPRMDYPEAVGMNHRRLAHIDSVLRRGVLNRAFPGAAVAVGRGSVVAKQETYGYYTFDRTEPVVPSSPYDLASLTKVVATTTAAMLLVEDGALALDAPVAEYLPDFAQAGKESITVRQLLTHSAGLPPYLPPDRRGESPEAIVDTVMATGLAYTPGTESRYSGLGFVTLMQIVEEISGRRFDVFSRERIFEPLGMHDTGFRSVRDATADYVVPTTDTADTTYQGSVHDPMARVMNGVSGNAGLFSTVEDLSRFATMLVNDGRIYGRQFLEAETIEQFTTASDVPGSTRALGWDTKSPEGYSSAGDHFSVSSFGHTGYTGTSFWVDPEQDLYVILLTNRVYPDDTDDRIQGIRPKVANHAYQSIVGPPQPLLPGEPAAERTE